MLHKLNIAARIAILVAVNILALSLDKVENLVALTLASLSIWAATRPDMRKVKFTLMIILPVVWSIVLMQGLFYRGEPKTVILVLIPQSVPIIGQLTGGVYLYYQGLIYGLVQSLRLVSVMLVGLAVAWSTTESELIRMLGTKSRRLSVAVGVAIRSLDVVSSELSTVQLNVRLTSRGSLLLKAQQIVRPLIVQVLRRSYIMTLALLSRGFNPDRPVRTSVRLSLRDKIVIITALALSGTIGIIKLLALLFLYDILYIPVLENLYRWALTSL